MKRIDVSKVLRAGVFALALAFVPLSASALAQSSNNSNNGTLRASATDPDGSNYDWLNWLGLIGLLGLLPRKPETVNVRRDGPDDVRR